MNTKYIRDLINGLLIEETTGELDGASFGLHIGTPSFANPVKADMTPATFTTYAASVIAFDDWSEHVDANGNPYVAAPPVVFSPTNATNLPQTINGVYLFKGDNLINYRQLATPVTIVAAGQALHATPAFGLGGADLPPAEASIV